MATKPAIKKNNTTLSFYKKKDYYRAKGNKNIEFCCSKFDKIFSNKMAKFNILVSIKEKRGFSLFLAQDWRVLINDKEVPYVWRHVSKEIFKLFGQKFYFKITKR